MKVTKYPLVGDRYTWGSGETTFQVVGINDRGRTVAIAPCWPTGSEARVCSITFDDFATHRLDPKFTWVGYQGERLGQGQEARVQSHIVSAFETVKQLAADVDDSADYWPDVCDAQSYMECAVDAMTHQDDSDDLDGVA